MRPPMPSHSTCPHGYPQPPRDGPAGGTGPRSPPALRHPTPSPLHELVSDGREWFFPMELLDGVPFLTHVRGDDEEPNPPLTPEQLLRLRDGLRQLAAGIQTLHDAGKLHRDV